MFVTKSIIFPAVYGNRWVIPFKYQNTLYHTNYAFELLVITFIKLPNILHIEDSLNSDGAILYSSNLVVIPVCFIVQYYKNQGDFCELHVP